MNGVCKCMAEMICTWGITKQSVVLPHMAIDFVHRALQIFVPRVFLNSSTGEIKTCHLRTV
jgi:hypothetical protein